MHPTRGRYSYLIRPILQLSDFIVVAISAYFFMPQFSVIYFFTFLFFAWFFVAFFLNFYDVYRFTKITRILALILQQGLLFWILLFAYFGVLKIHAYTFQAVIFFFISVTIGVGFFKILTYYALRKYRYFLGGNHRNVILVGNTKSTRQLHQLFTSKKELGYRVLGVFSDDLPNTVSDSFTFIQRENIDEIYCATEEVSDEAINYYVKFADENHRILKFIPKSIPVFTKRLQTDYYGYLPILSIPKVALHHPFNRAIKRTLDLFISLLVIMGVLSWLTPLLFVLIKLESPGPLFFVHKRNGINYKEFRCLKFRSMQREAHANHEVKKNDDRVTSIGRFLRKTSIDELPQFINVVLGSMSVVGPRPHMLQYTQSYAKKIDKYNYVFRHCVKPGITGLAQVSGYRGEITRDEDIINRVKYDIFYIENWSLLLDLKIIMDTVVNMIRGEEKAY